MDERVAGPCAAKGKRQQTGGKNQATKLGQQKLTIEITAVRQMLNLVLRLQVVVLPKMGSQAAKTWVVENQAVVPLVRKWQAKKQVHS